MILGSLILVLLAALTAGVIGTETRLLFFWPSCALLGVASLLLIAKRRIRMAASPNEWCLLISLMTAGYFVWRAAVSPVQEYAREDWILICSGLVAYLITVTAGSRSWFRNAVLALLLVLGVGNFVVGMIHFSGDWEFNVLPNFARDFGTGRIGGFYNDPNHLAAFFSVLVFLALGQLCFGRGGATLRLVLGFFVITGMLGMALTVSRGVLVGLGAGMLVFAACGLHLIIKSRPHLVARVLILCTVLGVIAGAVLWKVNEAYVKKRADSLSGAEDVRWTVWQAALLQYEEQPLIGAGARMFYEGSSRYRSPDVPVWIGDSIFAHNEYLQALADYGWVGLVLLLLVLIVHLWNGMAFVRWQAIDKSTRGDFFSNRTAQTVGAISALVASATHAAFEFHWHVGGLVLVGAVLLGYLANPGVASSVVPPRKLPAVRLASKVALAAAGVALLYGAAIWGRSDWFQATAERYALSDRVQAGLTQMEQSISLDPANASKLAELANYRLDAIGEEEDEESRKQLLFQAREELEKAAELNPYSYLIATTLADIHFACGEQEKALADIQRALVLAPQYEEPRLALALYHHRRREYAQAERAYLWASRSSAVNEAMEINWQVGYNQLLMDTGNLPLSPPEPPSEP